MGIGTVFLTHIHTHGHTHAHTRACAQKVGGATGEPSGQMPFILSLWQKSHLNKFI